MDADYQFSEYNKFPLGHNRTNGVVCSKIKLTTTTLFIVTVFFCTVLTLYL